jgi:undecaprenyl-diphosphatase
VTLVLRASIAAWLVATLAGVARAEPSPAYRLVPAVDVPVIALGATISTAWLLSSELAPPSCAPVCDDAELLPVDRWAAGRWDPTWSRISDVVELGIVGGSIVALLVIEGPARGLNDAVVVGEAMLASTALAVILQMSTRRARPFAYGTAAPLEERTAGNAGLSFYSGHTAVTVAAATATSATFLRLGRPGLAVGAGIVGAVGGGIVGTGRMLGGNHFLTDVLAGAVAGVSNGILVPALHASPDAGSEMMVMPLPGPRGVEGIQLAGAL